MKNLLLILSSPAEGITASDNPPSTVTAKDDKNVLQFASKGKTERPKKKQEEKADDACTVNEDEKTDDEDEDESLADDEELDEGSGESSRTS